MTETHRNLLSQLIGMARAADGSPFLITPEAADTMLRALRALGGTEAEAAEAVPAVIDRKRIMVPDCFSCTAPCGRTSPFDLDLLALDPAPVRAMKEELLSLLPAAAGRSGEYEARELFFPALIGIGTQPVNEEALADILNRIRALAGQEEPHGTEIH